MEKDPSICCPPSEPSIWDGKTVQWQDKRFIKDRTISFMHIPLNMSSVIAKMVKKIEAAGAMDSESIMLADENSLWGSDVYFQATKEVPDAENALISGTFECKVFEGEFRQMGNWVKEMQTYVGGKGLKMSKLYFYYTTCPKCAKKYGKNYVVLMAKVG